MLEKPFIQIDREIITKIPNTTEAVILSYIVHEQVSSFKNNNKIRKITKKQNFQFLVLIVLIMF